MILGPKRDDEMSYLAGIDAGTTGTKVTIYDEGGTKIDSSYCEYTLSSPEQYWVELNPEIWWKAVCRCFQQIFHRAKVSSLDIKAIGVSSTNALILLDDNGKPVRPAIMQLDQRAGNTLDDIVQGLGEEYVERITKNRIACGAFWGPTLLWLKQNRFQDLKNTRYFMTPHSYINYELTGVYAIDPSRASTTMLYDVNSGTWDEKLCQYFGVDSTLLPPIYPSTQIIGKLTGEAAVLTGLAQETPVVSGCMDSLAGHFGTGATGASASLILGSVGRICFNTAQTDSRFMNTVNSVDSCLFSMTPTNSTGISYKWIRELLFEEETAKQKDIYRHMDNMAGESPVGAKGLIYHPYISGERSPIWNPKATGSFFGITTEHKREDFIRAVLEGVGYSLAHNYKIIRENRGGAFSVLHASGGGAQSDIWLQLLADILGCPIKVPSNSDSETLGAAILAGISINTYKDIQDGIAKTVSYRSYYEPDNKSHKTYQEYLKMYLEIYEANKNLHKNLRALRKRNKESLI